MYFVNESHTFENIPKLVEYHKLNSGGAPLHAWLISHTGIVTRLRRSISEANAPISVGLGHDVWELERGGFTLGRELGSGQVRSSASPDC